MSLQDKENNNSSTPDIKDDMKEFQNNSTDELKKDVEKSVSGKYYHVDVAYMPATSKKMKKETRNYKLEPPRSAYDDLDDYIYKYSKKRKRKVRHTESVDDYFYSTRSNKSKHHKKKMKLWKKILISILCVLLALIIGLVSTVLFLDNKGKKQLLQGNQVVDIKVPDKASKSEDGKFVVTEDGKKYRYNDNITTILCMGVDRESLGNDDIVGDGGSADTLFLITLDTSNGATKMVSISRDTMAEVGVYSTTGNYVGTEEMQICLAYSYGDGYHTSCQNQIRAVSQLFYNIPINSYLSLDLEGIEAINDSIGGITVTSPETIGPFVAGETYTLHGKDAETFVRQRTLEVVEGNSLRMERQKIYVESFVNELISKTKENIKTPLNLFETATPYICTNLDASRVTYLGMSALRGQFSSGSFEVKKIEGKLTKGEVYAEFYPDEEKFFQTFLDIFYIPVN